ncbi:MAG: M23 family metallopeptidase [Actinobacteria bacterium]|nr:M23 family metallopeptidase [Actinomycetota bacterium]
MPLIIPLISFLLCPGVVRPVDGEVVRGFAPQGAYGGHWGIDLAARVGTPVVAVGPGVVTFAGPVAGRLTVTVLHGGEVRSSYSYLSEIAVGTGDRVAAGTVLGRSGLDHETAALHLSVRIGDRYVDPAGWLACADWVPGDGVRLAPAGSGPALSSGGCDAASLEAPSILPMWPTSWRGRPPSGSWDSTSSRSSRRALRGRRPVSTSRRRPTAGT